MALNVPLTKSAQTLSLNLQKKGIVTPPSVDLAFLLDVSYSFEKEHTSMVTTHIIERLIPWGMVFDPDKKLDVISFSHEAHYVGPITDDNYATFMRDFIIDKCPNWKGGTAYAPAIKKALTLFQQEPSLVTIETPNNSFFGKLFGLKKKTFSIEETTQKKKGLVLILTDGETGDKQETFELLKRSQERHDDVYFIFFGFVQNGRKNDFDFIRQLGDEFDNTAFVMIDDPETFIHQSDDSLNEMLIGDELIRWLQQTA